MKRGAAFLVAIAVLSIALATSVSAIEIQKPGGRVTAAPIKRNSALTEGECKGLGGTVRDTIQTTCATGKRCVTVDKDGVLHAACITEAR